MRVLRKEHAAREAPLFFLSRAGVSTIERTVSRHKINPRLGVVSANIVSGNNIWVWACHAVLDDATVPLLRLSGGTLPRFARFSDAFQILTIGPRFIAFTAGVFPNLVNECHRFHCRYISNFCRKRRRVSTIEITMPANMSTCRHFSLDVIFGCCAIYLSGKIQDASLMKFHLCLNVLSKMKARSPDKFMDVTSDLNMIDEDGYLSRNMTIRTNVER